MKTPMRLLPALWTDDPSRPRRHDFEIIQICCDGRLHTARALAGRLGVSIRTLWRDMASLQASGLPVDGKRGVGYILREAIDLSPPSLTKDEVKVLRLGAALVAWGADPSLARAAELLRAKVESVLPDRLRRAPLTDGPHIFTGRETEDSTIHLTRAAPCLARTVAGQDRLPRRGGRLHDPKPAPPRDWSSEAGSGRLPPTARLALTFAPFRLDRIERLTLTDTVFPAEAGRERAEYMARKNRPSLTAGP